MLNSTTSVLRHEEWKKRFTRCEKCRGKKSSRYLHLVLIDERQIFNRKIVAEIFAIFL